MAEQSSLIDTMDMTPEKLAFILDDKVDLDCIEAAPRLSKMSWETGATHRQRVVEDDEFVGLAALGRNVPALQGRAIFGRNDDVRPTGHAIVVGCLVEETAEGFDDRRPISAPAS